MFRLIDRAKVKDEGGWTLVELLISIMIFTIVLAGILLFFDFGLNNSKQMQVRSNLNQEAGNAIEKMVRQIRVAHKFMVPTLTGSMTGNPIYFSGDVRATGTERNIMFYRTTDNILYTRDESDTPTLNYEMAKDVTNLVFTYYDSTGAQFVDGTPAGQQITNLNRVLIKRVDISLTMQRKSGSGTVTSTKTGTVYIRSTLLVEVPGTSLICGDREIRANA